jgi:hypothetical protein
MADKLAMSALPCPTRPTPPLVLNLTTTTTKLGIRPVTTAHPSPR